MKPLKPIPHGAPSLGRKHQPRRTMAAPMDASSTPAGRATSFALPREDAAPGCTEVGQKLDRPCSAPSAVQTSRMASTSAHHSPRLTRKEKSSHNERRLSRAREARVRLDVRAWRFRAGVAKRGTRLRTWVNGRLSLPSRRVSSASERISATSCFGAPALISCAAGQRGVPIVPRPVFGLVFEGARSRALCCSACVERETATAAVSRTRRFMAGGTHTRGLFWREFYSPR